MGERGQGEGVFAIVRVLSMMVYRLLAQSTTPPRDLPAPPSSEAVRTLVRQSSTLLTEYGFRVVGALLFLAFAWIVSAWLMRVMVRGLTSARIDVTLAKFLSNVARWALFVLVVIACLGIFGVPATSFVTVLGTAGLAIGLAVQGSLSHLAAGVMLMIFRPFRVGDSVILAGQAGIVDEIELFSTRLDTPDNRRVIIPNSQVFNSIIINVTHHPQRRIDVIITVTYGADIEQTRQALLRALSGLPGMVGGRPIAAIVSNFLPAGVEWTVSVWVESADFGRVRQAVMQRVKTALDSAGIAVAIQHMQVKPA